MKSISSVDLTRIAEDLLTGMRVFIHKDSGEILIIPNEMNLGYTDPELWENEFNLLENNRIDYLEINAMNSNQSFQVMEDFADQMADNKVLRVELLDALNRKKPFREFKYVIDNSGKYREQWFGYRLEKTIEYVKKQIGDPHGHEGVPFII